MHPDRKGNHIPYTSVGSLYQAHMTDLRRIARAKMFRERAGHILEPDALVSETYLRIAKRSVNNWHDDGHFVSDVSQTMTRVLIDLGRKRTARKHGGGATRVELCEDSLYSACIDLDIVIRDLLESLRKRKPRVHRSIMLRARWGFSAGEISTETGVSTKTVKRDWQAARKWLARELGRGAE